MDDFIFSGSGITWYRSFIDDGEITAKPGWHVYGFAQKIFDPPDRFDPNIATIDYRWRLFGFDFANSHVTNERTIWFLIPYWSIVIPLTLLSAWLLLSKPRAKKN